MCVYIYKGSQWVCAQNIGTCGNSGSCVPNKLALWCYKWKEGYTYTGQWTYVTEACSQAIYARVLEYTAVLYRNVSMYPEPELREPFFDSNVNALYFVPGMLCVPVFHALVVYIDVSECVYMYIWHVCKYARACVYIFACVRTNSTRFSTTMKVRVHSHSHSHSHSSRYIHWVTHFGSQSGARSSRAGRRAWRRPQHLKLAARSSSGVARTPMSRLNTQLLLISRVRGPQGSCLWV